MTDRDRDREPRDRDRDERPDRQHQDLMTAIERVAGKIDYVRERVNRMSDATTAAFTELSGKFDQVILWAGIEEQALRDQLAAAEQAATDARAEAEAAKADDAADDAAVAAAEDRATTAEGVAAALQETMTGFETNVLNNIAGLTTKVGEFGATTGQTPTP